MNLNDDAWKDRVNCYFKLMHQKIYQVRIEEIS